MIYRISWQQNKLEDSLQVFLMFSKICKSALSSINFSTSFIGRSSPIFFPNLKIRNLSIDYIYLKRRLDLVESTVLDS